MTSAYTVYMIRDAWFYICCNLFLFVAIIADICNIDRNRPTFHSEKTQTQMNFLFWLAKWFNFICNIIIHFQSIRFEIVIARELPSSVKMTKITDTLCKMEVYGLLCNARSYLVVIRDHTIFIIENIFMILIKGLHDPQRQVKETVLYWLPAPGRILAERDPVRWCPALLGLIWSSWGLHYDKNIGYKSMSKTSLLLHD